MTTSKSTAKHNSLNLVENTLYNFFKNKVHLPIVIAYSGGVDSHVLLHALSALKTQKILPNDISVIHVNHGLSKNAKAWEDNARTYCKLYGLALNVSHVKISPQAQKSLEAQARDARYHEIKTYAPADALIVTGHHNDDQAETFFLALKRGSGLKGLRAMSSARVLLESTNQTSLANKQKLVRPLLALSREDLLAYANEHALTWVEDESNQDTSFDRNFIRRDILPLFKKRWPSFLKTLYRTTEHLQESQQLLDELAELDMSVCLNDNQRLSLSCLQKLSQARFNNLLRYFLAKNNYLMPSTEQLKQAYKQLSHCERESIKVKLGDVFLRNYKDEIYLTFLMSDLKGWNQVITSDMLTCSKGVLLPDYLGTVIFTRGKECLDAAITHKVKAPQNDQVVSIRFTHDNPKCLPDYRRQSRPLKKVLQELSIPPWERKRLPFLYYDNELVAVIGYFVCQSFSAPTLDTTMNIYFQN